jgi:glycosyltransferase involved in cell wall biosynthesis
VSLLRDHEKNVRMLLEAARLVDERGIDFALDLVGDGPDRGELEAVAGKLGLLQRRVRFLGAKSSDEVRANFDGAHFSVVSSRYETFCMAAAESLAAGRPVISTRCGGPEDYVDESAGLLVANDDPHAMADAIHRMTTHYPDYDPQHLHERIRERFSPQVVVKQLTTLYEDVLRPGAGSNRRVDVWS